MIVAVADCDPDRPVTVASAVPSPLLTMPTVPLSVAEPAHVNAGS